MPPLQVLDGQGWNTVYSNGTIQGPVGGIDGLISIPETPQGKLLHGASLRWSFNGAPPGTNPLQYTVRMAVFTGVVDPNSVLGFSAFGATNFVKAQKNFSVFPGVKRVLLDVLVPVYTPYNHNWTVPIFVEENTALSMAVSRPIDDTGSQAAANVGICYMSLYGYDNKDIKNIDVKFR